MIGSVLVTLTDADLLELVRQGDETAFTELYSRHREVASRMAATYCRSGEADDLVDLAFEKVLGALRRGRGPTEAFRAYLFVTLRRLAAEQAARPQEWPFGDVPEPLAAVSSLSNIDPVERQMVTSAFESLPGRWQAILWHTAVEGRNPRELSSLLGMSANAVAALAYRAREKLRQAYLQAHLQAAAHPECEPHRSNLGSYVRDGLSTRERRATIEHLEHCRSCRRLVAELLDVNRLLARSVLPLFGPVSAGPLTAVLAAGAGAGAGTGGAHFRRAAQVAQSVQAANAAEAGSAAVRRSVAGWVRLHQLGAVASGAAATAALLLGLTRLPHVQSKDPALPPPPGTTLDAPDPGSPTAVDAVRASQVMPCTVPGAPDSTAGGPMPPTTVGAASPAELTEVVCTATAPGRGELTFVVTGTKATTTTPAVTSSTIITTTVSFSGGGADVDLETPVADARVTIALDDGARVALEVALPEGCAVSADRQGLTCTLGNVLPGVVAGTTVGLEVDAPLGDAPSATVTLSDGEQTIASETLDLSTVTEALGIDGGTAPTGDTGDAGTTRDAGTTTSTPATTVPETTTTTATATSTTSAPAA